MTYLILPEHVRASVPAHLPVLASAVNADAPPPLLDLMDLLALSGFSWKLNCKVEAGEVRFGSTVWHPAWPTTAMVRHPGRSFAADPAQALAYAWREGLRWHYRNGLTLPKIQ